jgi:hypothetical protein
MERFDEMPDGWKVDRSWGSPECGWMPICDGISVLKGGRKGLLRVNAIKQTEVHSNEIAFPQKKAVPDLSKNELVVIADTTNQLARARFKEKLLQEILFDLQVCLIEGWDCSQYVKEIKELIDETYRKISTVNQSLTVQEFSESA